MRPAPLPGAEGPNRPQGVAPGHLKPGAPVSERSVRPSNAGAEERTSTRRCAMEGLHPRYVVGIDWASDKYDVCVLAGGGEHADVVLVAGPVDPDHVPWMQSFHRAPPSRGSFLCSGVGRSHRSLTDRRSGLQVPWRDTLWSVGAFRAGQGSGSHASPHGASDAGSPYPDAEALLSAVKLPHPTRKVHQ